MRFLYFCRKIRIMKERSITIGYVCETDPRKDRFAWSGLIYKLREAIEMAGFEVVWIPFYENTKFLKLAARLKWFLYRKGGERRILGGVHFLPEAYGYAKSINKDENFNRCDVLFFPRGAQISLFLNTNKPIIYHSDATVFGMVDYYWMNCHPLSVKMACWLEKKASRKAALNIRASKWAADSVIKDCGCDPKRCKVIEFGANFDESDISPIIPYQKGKLEVLFSGVEWDRKGGDIAIETVRILRSRGYDAMLNIVGIKKMPDYCSNLDYVVNHGFLNKNKKDEYLKYLNLFKECHLLLLPTHAECAGIVFCEASAFGMPVYSYVTGGTENYVINGVNGYALPIDQGAIAFANRISKDIDQGNMLTFHNGALDLYKEKLSWKAWANHFKQEIGSIFVKV